MKHFSGLTLLLIIALLISACAAKATPTLSVADMQRTAAVVALTIVAETQTAMPTVTQPAPTETPTNTPPPTNTFIPLPPTGAPSTAAANGSSGSGDPCINQVLPPVLEGNQVKIRVNNSTKATVNLTVYLNRTIPPIVCGYRAYSLEPQQSVVINDLVEGCYTLWAWNPEPKGYFIVTNGAASCLDSSYPWAFDISTRDIRLK